MKLTKKKIAALIISSVILSTLLFLIFLTSTQIEILNSTGQDLELSIQITEQEYSDRLTSINIYLNSEKSITIGTEGGVKTISIQAGKFSAEELFDQWTREKVKFNLKFEDQVSSGNFRDLVLKNNLQE